MATAVWTGTLSFGLITLPVRLYPATQPRTCASTCTTARAAGSATSGSSRPNRVRRPSPTSRRRRRPSADDDASAARERAGSSGSVETPVAWEDVVRGVETDEGELVTVPKEELERIRPGRSRSDRHRGFRRARADRPRVVRQELLRDPDDARGDQALRAVPPRDARGGADRDRDGSCCGPSRTSWRSDRWRRCWPSRRCSSATRSRSGRARSRPGRRRGRRARAGPRGHADRDPEDGVGSEPVRRHVPGRAAPHARGTIADEARRRRADAGAAGGSPVEELMAALKESVAAAKRDRTRKKATG